MGLTSSPVDSCKKKIIADVKRPETDGGKRGLATPVFIKMRMNRKATRQGRGVFETLEQRQYMSTATLSVSAEALAFQRGVDHWFLDWGNGTAYQQLTSAAAKSAPGTSPSAPAAASTPVSTSAPVAASEPVTASARRLLELRRVRGHPRVDRLTLPRRLRRRPHRRFFPRRWPRRLPWPMRRRRLLAQRMLGYSDSSPVSDPGGASGMNDFTPVLESGTAEAGRTGDRDGEFDGRRRSEHHADRKRA